MLKLSDISDHVPILPKNVLYLHYMPDHYLPQGQYMSYNLKL